VPHLLQAILQGVDGSLMAKLKGGVTTEAAPKASGRRSLLYRRSGDSGYNQATVNSIAASNTAAAIDAAASGYVPAGAATAYGSYQAEAAASYGNNCYNCYYGDRWRGH
jgi:cobalamin biosynthesis protein CbiD